MAEPQATEIISVDPRHPAPEAIARAGALLRAGALVAFPTETVYGLGANATDPAAVARIFTAKGRPLTDPLIVHIHNLDQLAAVAADVPAAAAALTRRFWPGPLTLVLRRGPIIPPIVAAGLDTVAVRMPAHPTAQALLAAAGVPVVAPSANLFARPSPTRAEHVAEDLMGRIALILDAGPTNIGVESTIVNLASRPPELLRPGGVPLEELRPLLPDLVYTPRYLAEDDAGEQPTAPGMLLKHYAPRAELLVFDGPPAQARTALQAEATRRLQAGARVGVLATSTDATELAGSGVVVALLGMRDDDAETASRLFAALRDLDRQGCDVILVRAPAGDGMGLAVRDRLIRGAAGNVVRLA